MTHDSNVRLRLAREQMVERQRESLALLTKHIEAPDCVNESVELGVIHVDFRYPDPLFDGHLAIAVSLTVEGDEYRIGRAMCPAHEETFGMVVDCFVRAEQCILAIGLHPARKARR